MRRFLLRSLHILLPLTLLVAVTVFRWAEPEVLLRQKVIVFDLLNQWFPRPYNSNAPVRIVDIDDESLEKIGQWPWPRTKLAALIDRLEQANAAVVAFDIVFSEADRTSPQNVVENWSDNPKYHSLRSQVREMPDHDREFAKRIERFGRVVTGFVLTPGAVPRLPVQRGNFAYSSADPKDHPSHYIPRLPGAVANLKIFEDAAAGNGNFNVLPEIDGLIRRVPLLIGFHRSENDTTVDRMYPLISIEALRVVQGAKTMKIKLSGASGELSFGERTGFSSIQVGQFVIPTDEAGRMWVHYSGSQPKRYVPAWKVLDGSADPALLDSQVILVGSSAAGLLDLRSTPLDKVLPGVEVHAEIIEQVLEQIYLKQPDWDLGAEIAFMIILGLVLIYLLPRLGAVWCAAIGSVAVATVVGAAIYAYTDYQLLVDPVYPSFAVLAIYLSASLVSYVRTESERNQVRGAFAQYLSPALVEQLAENPDQLALGGETKEMTFLFCDVRGFTTISETFKSNPHGLTTLINRLLTPLTNAILSRKGTIDKYMGDCIMAFWNAPLDDPDHAVHACESALAMFVELDTLNASRRAEAEAEGVEFMPLNVGAGINTGECVVGNMGSEQRFDYSVLGDPVNLAARLEGQSKNYGVDIVLGPDTAAAAAGRFAILELDQIEVKGKTEAVNIYCLLGDEARASSAVFHQIREQHDRMLAAYRRQDWDMAEAQIAACRTLSDGEIAEFYDLYEERIAEFRQFPPPPDWDGVFVATTK